MTNGSLQELTTAAQSNDLPALIDRAASALTSAKTSGEVLEARDMARVAYDAAKSAARIARAKDAHDEIIAAVYRAQGDAARIEARAKIRLADEYDAAQDRGEVATDGRPKTVSDGNGIKPTAADIGLSRKDIHEARILRDAEQESPGIVDRVIDDRVEMGVEPTKAAIRQAAEEATGKHVRGTFGTGENEWYTPQEYIDSARKVLGHFDLDPASSEHANTHHVCALNFYTKEDNGLARDWFGRVWMNPPYSQPLITQFCEKLRADYESGDVIQAIALTHNYSDTGWFHHLAAVSRALCFTKGRVRFEAPDGTKAAPTQGQTFFYLGHEPSSFVSQFAQFGLVLVRAE